MNILEDHQKGNKDWVFFKVFSNGSQILLLPNITLLEMRGQVDNWYICLCSILQIVTCIPPVPILLSKKRWGHVSALHLLGELCKIETQKKPEHKGGGRCCNMPNWFLATSKREQETTSTHAIVVAICQIGYWPQVKGRKKLSTLEVGNNRSS